MVSLTIGLVVLAPLITRQVLARPLGDSYRIPLILAVTGIIEFIQYLHGHPAAIAAAAGGSLVLAAASGAVRAPTVRIWTQEAS